MSKRNIWEIVTVNDLVKILKENEDKFCIVALTLQETPDNDVKMIKKFLKDYSKIYKNLTFLYLKLSDKDLGRINIIKKDKNEYPFIYHIYNTSDIFVSVNRVNKKTLYESMNVVEKYYKKDLENRLEKLQENNNDNDNDNDNEHKSVVVTNLNINKNKIINQNQDKNQYNNTIGDDKNNNLNNDNDDHNDDKKNLTDLQNNEEMQRKVLEHENLLNQIIIFEEKKKQHNLHFLEDIQKRKKEEKNKR